MLITLSEEEKAALAKAAAEERRVRHWRRYQAILLLGQGTPPEAVAAC